MKKSLIVLIALLVAVTFTVTLAYAQDQAAPKAKKEAAAKLDRVDGVIQSINKETSTLQVKNKKSGLIRPVIFSDATKITKVNKPGGTLADLKENVRIIALGTFDAKKQLNAARIDIRE